MAKSRKLPMVKRGTQKERSVSFTKRRQGLFNKAAELSMLCDAQITVLVASPSEKKRKMYSFGESSVASILDAYFQNGAPPRLDDNKKQKSVDLWKKIDLLESQPGGLDDFEGSESVGDLQKLVGAFEKKIAGAKQRLEFEKHGEHKYSYGANMMVQSASFHELKDCEMIKRIDGLNNENRCCNYVGEGSENTCNDLIYGNVYPLPQDYALEKMIAGAKGRLELEDHDEYKYSYGANMMVQSASSQEFKGSKMTTRMDHELNNENSCWNYEGEGSNNPFNNDLIFGNEYPLPQDYFWSPPLLI